MTNKSQHRQKPRRVSKRPGQPGGVRDTNRKEKERVLLDAALLLFLARGVEGVSVDDITKSAEVAKGSFYRYFKDQEALVDALVQPTRKVLMTALAEQKHPKNRLIVSTKRARRPVRSFGWHRQRHRGSPVR